jgi:hypothetical protein
VGRPRKEIDWKKVDDLLIAGCSGAEIAGYLGINPKTLYEHCEEEKGMLFSDYSSEYYSKGDAILRAHQFAKALGKVVDGDNTLLIWLGKNRLKQERKEKEFESSLRQKEEGAKQSTYNIIVPNDLAIGANIPAQKVPDKANTSPE